MHCIAPFPQGCSASMLAAVLLVACCTKPRPTVLEATSSYAAIDAAFWADVENQVGDAATPRFKQFCSQFREQWNAEAALDPAAPELDDEVARPARLDTGQFVTRHEGGFPGLTATPYWDARELTWLSPLVEAAPAIARELAAARGDAAGLAPGAAVDVFFEDGTSDFGTIDTMIEASCDVRYGDGEIESLDRSNVAPRGSAWLQRMRERYPWPRALEATGFEHFSLARAMATADRDAFRGTRAALKACRNRAPASRGRFHQYGSPRFVGVSRQRPRSALAAHSDLWNFVLTAHVPLSMPSAPRPGPRTLPPTLKAQAAVAPRHTRSGAAVAAADRATYAEALWGTAHERDGGAGMIVAGEARPWTEPLVFDTSFVHSAYNDGDAPADYLHIDFFHPELTTDEKCALATFQRCQGQWRKRRARLRRES